MRRLRTRELRFPFFLSYFMGHRVVIETVLAEDAKALTAIQAKINQWLTIGLMVKYEMHTTSTHVIFNILLKKEGQ